MYRVIAAFALVWMAFAGIDTASASAPAWESNNGYCGEASLISAGLNSGRSF